MSIRTCHKTWCPSGPATRLVETSQLKPDLALCLSSNWSASSLIIHHGGERDQAERRQLGSIYYNLSGQVLSPGNIPREFSSSSSVCTLASTTAPYPSQLPTVSETISTSVQHLADFLLNHHRNQSQTGALTHNSDFLQQPPSSHVSSRNILPQVSQPIISGLTSLPTQPVLSQLHLSSADSYSSNLLPRPNQVPTIFGSTRDN